jgi:hypothetical protein
MSESETSIMRGDDSIAIEIRTQSLNCITA